MPRRRPPIRRLASQEGDLVTSMLFVCLCMYVCVCVCMRMYVYVCGVCVCRGGLLCFGGVLRRMVTW